MSVHATSHHIAAQRARLATLDPWGKAMAPLMSEDSGRNNLLDTIRSAIRDLKLWSYHTHRSDRSDKGFPDLVIIGPRGVYYRELKSEEGKVTSEQLDVISKLEAAGQDVDVWRPTDWYSGRIQRELAALR